MLIDTLYDSRENGNPIAPRQIVESPTAFALSSGSYSVHVELEKGEEHFIGEFYLEIQVEHTGQVIASSDGNFMPACHFVVVLPQTPPLIFKIVRSSSTSSRQAIHYKLIVMEGMSFF